MSYLEIRYIIRLLGYNFGYYRVVSELSLLHTRLNDLDNLFGSVIFMYILSNDLPYFRIPFLNSCSNPIFILFQDNGRWLLQADFR